MLIVCLFISSCQRRSGGEAMFQTRNLSARESSREQWWKRYLIDLILTFIVGLLLTCLIFALPLHPRLATILLGYLFIVLCLVYTRGVRTAILAAFIGCAVLDFLFVPPILSIWVSQVEDGWELLIFLLFAVTLSYSYSRMRNRMEKVKRQKDEESMRYEEQLRKQLDEVSR